MYESQSHEIELSKYICNLQIIHRQIMTNAIFCPEQLVNSLIMKSTFPLHQIQGQSTQTGFFELALRYRNLQVRFFWKVFLKS